MTKYKTARVDVSADLISTVLFGGTVLVEDVVRIAAPFGPDAAKVITFLIKDNGTGALPDVSEGADPDSQPLVHCSVSERRKAYTFTEAEKIMSRPVTSS